MTGATIYQAYCAGCARQPKVAPAGSPPRGEAQRYFYPIHFHGPRKESVCPWGTKLVPLEHNVYPTIARH